jgi:hypothetical protein
VYDGENLVSEFFEDKVEHRCEVSLLQRRDIDSSYLFRGGGRMATDNFRDDVSAAFRKFIKANTKRPSALKVPFEDALVWHDAARTNEMVSATIQEFVAETVTEYVHTLPWNREPLTDCGVVLLGVESGEQTHFE